MAVRPLSIVAVLAVFSLGLAGCKQDGPAKSLTVETPIQSLAPCDASAHYLGLVQNSLRSSESVVAARLLQNGFLAAVNVMAVRSLPQANCSSFDASLISGVDLNVRIEADSTLSSHPEFRKLVLAKFADVTLQLRYNKTGRSEFESLAKLDVVKAANLYAGNFLRIMDIQSVNSVFAAIDLFKTRNRADYVYVASSDSILVKKQFQDPPSDFSAVIDKDSFAVHAFTNSTEGFKRFRDWELVETFLNQALENSNLSVRELDDKASEALERLKSFL